MTAAVLIAADTEPPGQPYISPDDLAAIGPLWDDAVEEHLMPLAAGVWDDSAGMIHAEMLDATDVDFPFPSVGSVTAEEYMSQVRNVYKGVGDELWQTAQAQLAEGFAAGESIPQLVERLQAAAGLTARRATLVARSTVIEASNAGAIATARAAGIDMQKEWIATPDERTRPTHHTADGQKVGLADPFTVGGFSADVPGDPGLPPQEKYNCRCTVGFVMADAVAKQAKRDAQPELPLPGTSGAVKTPAAAPTPPAQPTAEARAAARRAARVRQKVIDKAEPVADFAAEVDQVAWLRRNDPFDDDLTKILGQRIRAASAAGVPAEDLAAIQAAVDARDIARVRAEARRLAEAHDLAPVDAAGQRVPFDPVRHQALVEGTEIADGQLVVVDRQGHVLRIGDEVLPLDRAKVRVVSPEVPTPTRPLGLHDDAASQQVTLDAARAGLGRRPSKLTPAQRKALREYQATGYYGINGQIRRHEIDKFTQRRIDLIDAAVESSPLDHDVVLWRGSRTGRGIFGDRLDHDLTGLEWLEEAYVSSSASRQVAVDFTYAGTVEAPGLVMRVVVPKGVGAVELSGLEAGGQAELLLRRGLRMRVVRDRGISPQGYRLLDVEVMPAPRVPAVVRAVSPEERLRAGMASGIRSSEPFTDGAVGQVDLLTFNDGSQAIRKVAHKPYVGFSPEDLTDREELAALVGRSIGAPVPAVVRTATNEVIMEYVPDTRTGWKALGRTKAQRDGNQSKYTNTDDGRLLGIMDILTRNNDRHDGNWLVRKDGSIVGIDHGLTWFERQFQYVNMPPADLGRFATAFAGHAKWIDNSLSPTDVEWLTRQLEALRPRFAERGREDWLGYSLTRLRQIGEHATGTIPKLSTDLVKLAEKGGKK